MVLQSPVIAAPKGPLKGNPIPIYEVPYIRGRGLVRVPKARAPKKAHKQEEGFRV